MRYETLVEVLCVNELGEKKWSIIRDSFENDNPLIARCNAIERIENLRQFFFEELSEDITFNTLEEAKDKGFKNFNMFFNRIIFWNNNDDWPVTIYGDLDELFEGLVDEAIYYLKLENPPNVIDIINAENETIQVLESNIDFFLN